MIREIKVENLLFIDIETVSQKPQWSELDEATQGFWEYKAKLIANELSAEDAYEKKAAIFAEFGKIICISIGYLAFEENEYIAKVKSFSDEIENELLLEFKDFILKIEKQKKNYSLCGHNIKEFDIPYICRRMLINGIELPSFLDFSSKKPWEVTAIDTLHLWRFGDYKNYTSLKILCHIFDIPTPKDEIDGSMVGNVYWVEQNLMKIVNYCQKDVVAVMQLIFRLQNRKLLLPSNVQIIE